MTVIGASHWYTSNIAIGAAYFLNAYSGVLQPHYTFGMVLSQALLA